MASTGRILFSNGQVVTSSGTTSTNSATLQPNWQRFILYVDVTAFTGTNITATLQHSADGTNYIDWGAPAAFTATGRKILDENSVTPARANLLPYVRVNYTGTLTSVTVTAALYYDPVK